MVVFEDDAKIKELTISKLWCGGAKSGNETAADVTFAGSAAGSTITFGKLSATGSNGTDIIFRGRVGDKGLYFGSSSGCLKIDDYAAPSAANSSAVLELKSITKAFFPPRMTTAQATTLSAALTTSLSGAVIYDTGLGKLKVWNGKVWETITSAAGA